MRERYAAAARAVAEQQRSASCCGPVAVGGADEAQVFGAALYGKTETTGAPAGAVAASLGYGVPTAVTDLHEGETVLDLGSGAGADVLISARRASRPDEWGAVLMLLTAPAADWVPEPLRSRPAVAILGGWLGAPERGERAIGQLRALAPVALDTIKPISHPELQDLLKPGPAGALRHYWSSDCLSELPDAAADTLISHATEMPSPLRRRCCSRVVALWNARALTRCLPHGAFRGRDGQLPGDPGGRNRLAVVERDRHRRHDPRTGGDARQLAAGRAAVTRVQRWRAGGGDLRAARLGGRGATVAFNFLHPDGRVVDERYVDRVATEHGVSLRTGCFCNPGAGEIAFTIPRETLVGHEFGEGMTLEDYVREVGLPSGGAVRASLGLVSNLADVHRFLDFASSFIDLHDVPGGLPARVAC